MAKAQLSHPFDEIHGALGKNEKIINRRKKFRDDKGRVIAEGSQEAYVVKHPRNWKKNPAKGKELEHQLRFKAACAETKRILMAAKYLKAQATQSTNPALPSDYTPTLEDLATLQYWQDRFKAQLQKPEPEAPIDPDTGRHKTYFRFDAFIRTCLLREMP